MSNFEVAQGAGWVLVVPNLLMGLLLGDGFGPRFLRNFVVTDLISDGATK